MDADISVIHPNGFQSVECERDEGLKPVLGTERVEHFQEQLTLGTRVHDAVPLVKDSLLLFIEEDDDDDEHHCSHHGDVLVSDSGADYQLDTGLECGYLCYQLMENFHTVGSATCNGYRITTVRRSLRDLQGIEGPEPDVQMETIQNSGAILNFSHPFNGLLPGPEIIPNMSSPECQYDNMSINEKLFIKIKSIIILPGHPEVRQVGNDEISQGIRNLEENYPGQGWDNISAGKSASSKGARQALLAFMRKTLKHCCKYEATGFSCFNGPPFKDILRSVATRLTEA
ncbi:hypothetical protein Nepgr_015584 [Nepenthes gracilis]|uniref:Uncharacterized protein n=1 Tax=Nepenthes gracilis TaxID=150966 RepID=A0AAD3SLD4_NEPGR|nr:hypothetical protein Nepgr_015584 [Nepenthes gracilis]